MNWPNRLTIFRILLVIPFIAIFSWATSIKGDYSYSNINLKTILFIVAGIIFLIAMITDWIDGFLARKWNCISTFGKIFDPTADKIITTSALIMLSINKITLFYLVIIIILRDILIDSLRNFATNKNIKVNVSIWGKAKTLVMSITIVMIFFIFPLKAFSNNNDIFFINIPLFISTILSVFSGFQYCKFVWLNLHKK